MNTILHFAKQALERRLEATRQEEAKDLARKTTAKQVLDKILLNLDQHFQITNTNDDWLIYRPLTEDCIARHIATLKLVKIRDSYWFILNNSQKGITEPVFDDSNQISAEATNDLQVVDFCKKAGEYLSEFMN